MRATYLVLTLSRAHCSWASAARMMPRASRAFQRAHKSNSSKLPRMKQSWSKELQARKKVHQSLGSKANQNHRVIISIVSKRTRKLTKCSVNPSKSWRCQQVTIFKECETKSCKLGRCATTPSRWSHDASIVVLPESLKRQLISSTMRSSISWRTITLYNKKETYWIINIGSPNKSNRTYFLPAEQTRYTKKYSATINLSKNNVKPRGLKILNLLDPSL